MRRLISSSAAVVALLLGACGAAYADAIDGDWCFEGRHFTIRGSNIDTPEGAKVVGDYSRHRFSYVSPDSGAEIFMVLMNETTLRLRVGADQNAPIETWRRCDVTS